jgi:hypothetical protein
MKVAIISAYYNESLDVLRRCHDSVKTQTHTDVTHYFVSDGNPNTALDTWDCVHIKLPNHNDYGDTPRAVGSLSAVALNYDAVVFLDADNFLTPDHIEKMVSYSKFTGADIVTATRFLVDIDGKTLGVCNESDGNNFNDTNCYFITSKAFDVFRYLGFKSNKHGIVGDRMFWNAVKQMPFSRSHFSTPTVYYTTTFAFHYQVLGLTPPDHTKVIVRFSDEEHHRMISYPEYVKLTKGQK